MTDNIGGIYNLIVSIIILTIGVLIMVYRKKYLELLRKKMDFWNEQSESYAYTLMFIVGTVFVVFGIVNIVKFLR